MELLLVIGAVLLILGVIGLVGAWVYFAFTAAVAGVGYLLTAGGIAITTPVIILTAIGLLMLVWFGGSMGKAMFILLGITGAFVVWHWNLLLAILFFLPAIAFALLLTFGVLSIAAVVAAADAFMSIARQRRR